MIHPEDSAPAMSPFQDKPDTIDLSDLERDAGALVAEIARAGETIIAASSSPRPAPTKPAPKKPHADHADHADPSAMTDAAIDAAPENQPEIPPEYAPEPTSEEETAAVADSAAVAESVDDLITDALSAVDAIGEQTAAADSTPSESDAAAVAELAAEIDRLSAEAASLIESVESVETEEPVDSDGSLTAEDSTDTAADSVAAPVQQEPDDDSDTADTAAAAEPIADAERTPEPTRARQQVEPDAAGGVMASLDAAIESEAEALEDDLDTLEGDFETPDEVALGADRSLEDDTEYFDDDPVDLASVVIETRLDEEVESPAAHEKPRVHADAGAPASSTTASSVAPPVGSAAPAAAPGTGPAWKIALARLTSAATRDAIEKRALRPLAAPLLRLPPSMRDTIGWIGVNTLFIAVCLWLYLTLR